MAVYTQDLMNKDGVFHENFKIQFIRSQFELSIEFFSIVYVARPLCTTSNAVCIHHVTSIITLKHHEYVFVLSTSAHMVRTGSEHNFRTNLREKKCKLALTVYRGFVYIHTTFLCQVRFSLKIWQLTARKNVLGPINEINSEECTKTIG